MVVKNISWKQPKFFSLAKYIANEDKSLDQEYILHNTLGNTIQDVVEEFKSNDKFLKLRSNSNRIIHEVVSFHPDDTPHLDADVIRDLVFKYLELRGSRNLAFGSIHWDKQLHAHLMISPNEVANSRVTHISRSKYLRIRKELEQYQRQKYEKLKSVVFLEKSPFNEKEPLINLSHTEYQYQKNQGDKNSDKMLLREILSNAYKQSQTQDEFYDRLLQSGCEIYTYRGKNRGILKNGRKYTFRILGITKEHILSLENKENDLIKKRLESLRSIQNDRPDIDLNR